MMETFFSFWAAHLFQWSYSLSAYVQYDPGVPSLSNTSKRAEPLNDHNWKMYYEDFPLRAFHCLFLFCSFAAVPRLATVGNWCVAILSVWFSVLKMHPWVALVAQVAQLVFIVRRTLTIFCCQTDTPVLIHTVFCTRHLFVFSRW